MPSFTMPSFTSRRRITSLGAGAATAMAVLACAAVAQADTGAARPVAYSPTKPLQVRTILAGAPHGWSSPDDLTSVGRDLYVSFQNGVPATGGSGGSPTQSTIVKLNLAGAIEQTWQLTGKCDGLTADPAHHRVIGTVNEDGNSSLYTIPTEGHAAPSHYSYDANPLPHGGGTDSITVYHGGVYVIASAPTAAGGPALYRVTLNDGVAHLAAAPFFDSSTATVANTGASGVSVSLALTDPDSSTVVPRQSPRFRGSFMLDAQGDQQAVFASHLGQDDQQLQVLNLSQSVDDTAFATTSAGLLVATDATAKSVVVITGKLTPGTAYTSVTPANANNAPSSPGPNYLGVINLNSGAVNAVSTNSPTFTPHSLIFVPIGD
ncbi:MAG: hypothetical protein M3N95_11745 [Actinomycetota bacterium]|nr:hypothetical protein [Actinomycetota bacterium]